MLARKHKSILPLFLLLGIILISCLVGGVKRKDGFEPKQRAYSDYFIVCSKYNKNTDFLKEIPIQSEVIDKTRVPNKANEATTYLHYIIERYDDLPENVIFIHDENESWHHEGKITDNIHRWIDEYERGGRKYYSLNHLDFDYTDTMKRDNPAFQSFWNETMKPAVGDLETAKCDGSKCCAQFIVSREKIREKPKSFYQNMYDWLIKNTNGEGSGDKDDMYSGRMTGTYAEYAWKYMFY